MNAAACTLGGVAVVLGPQARVPDAPLWGELAVLIIAGRAQFVAASVRAAQLGATAWAAVVFIGTSSGIGCFLWLWALRHAPASTVTLHLSPSPLAALLLGGRLLHEPPAPALFVALLRVGLGRWVAQDRRP